MLEAEIWRKEKEKKIRQWLILDEGQRQTLDECHPGTFEISKGLKCENEKDEKVKG